MKTLRLLLWLAVCAPLLLLSASCESEYTYESSGMRECVITSVVMGGLNRTVTLKNSKGEDTSYVANITGSLYPLYIDQLNNRIYNADSLPVGTHAERVVFTTFNAVGNVAIRSLTSDEDTTFVMTDSTDCSVPRLLTVYSLDGLSQRTYTLEVNVHQQEGDSFVWNRLCRSDQELAYLEPGHRAVALDGQLHVFGTLDGQPVVAQAPTADPTGWTSTPLPAGFDLSSVQRFGGALYALIDGQLSRSADALTWTATGSSLAPQALVAAGTDRLYALADGAFYASADGVEWTQQSADRADMMPQRDVRGTCVPSATDALVEDIVVVGRTADGEAVVWRLNVDLSGTNTFDWYYLPTIDGYVNNCPQLAATSVVTYDGGTVLTGLDAGNNPAPLYWSADNGRTWNPDELTNPALQVGSATSVAAATDDEGYLWVVASGSGEVWRGRHNRLGWAETQTAFDRSVQNGAQP